MHAHRGESDFHKAARKRLVELANGDEEWALPVFTLTEFVRVVTHPAVMARPSSLAEAVSAVEMLTAAPTARVLLPGEHFVRHFIETVIEAKCTANLVFDAAIAAVCMEHGVRSIITEDRDFARFSRLRAVRLS